jgi:glycosyltransferase involved in cell wall biosynthesis
MVMKILIATGVYPPDIGGPAEYAKHLEEEFIRLGHTVTVLSYEEEKKMPIGVRHFYYFFRATRLIRDIDFVLALDTMSVGVPAVCAAKLFSKKIAIRIGGDFLWESYVERTGHLIPWAQFYKNHKMFSVKEWLIFYTTRFALRSADALAFNSEWQLNGTVPIYGLDRDKSSVILNFFGEPIPASAPAEKNFIWATRSIKLKNGQNLKKAFEEA